MKVLLSIKPEYIKKILDGEKKFEYRRSIFKNKNVKTIVMYSTSPVKKVVGEFTIKKIYCDNPKELWKNTSLYAGIDKDKYMDYFKNKDMGYAIEIGEISIYNSPKLLQELGIKTPPQSFIYLP